MHDLLDTINEPGDIKKIPAREYAALAQQIREFLIEKVSRTGGHLASNLGVVELTMALHLFLDLPYDKLIFDVGHQAYVHKILTGRREMFDTLRQLDGLSGFPKKNESPCDVLDTGHSSTSISLALGLVKARELNDGREKIVAVIGDGALTGGLAYEALNNAGKLKSNLIIVLNDNNMSISENVGAVPGYLGKIRTSIKYNDFKGELEETLNKVPGGKHIVKRLKISKDSIKHLIVPGMFFEDMGITYIGPIDGHNVNQVYEALKAASRKNCTVLIHAVTKKGKGYKIAEHEPTKFHGIDAFDIETGKSFREKHCSTYTEVFSNALVKIAEKNRNVAAVTAAMPAGCGLMPFKERFPHRFFDVGIAEEHAVTFSAGLSAAGLVPVVAVYSTFLQRAYDEILHDVCLNELHVVFAVDRAGLVGSDGPTHQGIYDISFLSSIPGMTLMAPKNAWELEAMLEFAINAKGPVAVRYPRGMAYGGLCEFRMPIEVNRAEWIYEGGRVVILACGSMVKTAVNVYESLKKEGIEAAVANMRFISPFDEKSVLKAADNYDMIATLEENVITGGFGEHVDAFLIKEGKKTKVINIALPCKFIEQGDVTELSERYNIDDKSITVRIISELSNIKDKRNG